MKQLTNLQNIAYSHWKQKDW